MSSRGRKRSRWLEVPGWLLLITTAAAVPVAADEGGPAETTVSAAESPDAVLQQALDLERRREWGRAIDVYEDGLEAWPTRVDFKHRKRLCETHYRVARRYLDQSFRNNLLKLSSTDAGELLDELLDKIESSYVEPVPFESLLRCGYDNLEVGLRDPDFLKAHAPGATEERVKWLRDALRSQRQQVRAASRQEARRWVDSACEVARRGLGLPSTAVTLEFVFGACDALDTYSGCLTPDRLADLYAEIDGNFVGIGVELRGADRGLKVVHVLPGGPASEAGMQAGDEITQVAGKDLAGMELDPAAALLQGPEASTFTLRVRRADGSESEMILVRRPVTVLSVEQASVFPGGVGYIRLTGFQKTTTEEMDRAIRDLQKQGMTHLVLDLRGNPGGLLNIAVELADRFLDRGLIVRTRGRSAGQTFDYVARPPIAWQMPTTVLIDHDSASASEILAGALKDHGRAEILGERSYGKGSVQSIYPLQAADAALKLTTAKFYSPKDRSYSEQGVEPDVVARAVAKPGGDQPSSEELLGTVGDPEKDTVLSMAIRRVRDSQSARASRTP